MPPPDVQPPALQPARKHLTIAPPSWSLPPLDSIQLPIRSAHLISLRVITWNVWFSPTEADARMAALFVEVLGHTPDVICLQEVVPQLAASIRGCPALRREYAISDNDVGSYGLLILARHSLRPSFTEVAYPSQMGRSLLIAEWKPPFAAGHVAVATTHLESLNNARTRAKQLRTAREALAPYEQAVLLGDFNFDSSCNYGDWRAIPPRPPRPSPDSDDDDRHSMTPQRAILENTVLAAVLPEYVDAWPALHPDQRGCTFDGRRNPYVADPEETMRYDRVLVRGMAPTAIVMLGERPPSTATTPAPASRQSTLVPSDHFGLCVELELRSAMYLYNGRERLEL